MVRNHTIIQTRRIWTLLWTLCQLWVLLPTDDADDDANDRKFEDGNTDKDEQNSCPQCSGYKDVYNNDTKENIKFGDEDNNLQKRISL